MKIIVSQIKGQARQSIKKKRTLEALGLGRIGKSRVHSLNPAVEGMVRSVAHLVRVEKFEYEEVAREKC